MKNLWQCITDAAEKGIALGHFNISDLTALKAIVEAARSLNVPVLIGLSEGERDFVGVEAAAALVAGLRQKYDYPIFLNADHSYSVERVKEAVDAGFDAVIFDGAKLSFEENVSGTKQAVTYAKKKRSRAGKPILVEGELGYIGSSSKIFSELPAGAATSSAGYTSPEEAQRFVKATGVHLFAPAVGNIHGMFAGAKNPDLDIPRIAAIKSATRVPLVLHGGSGLRDEEFVKAAKAGMSIIHINTEIRLAWREGLERGLKANPQEIAPYKVLPAAVASIQTVVANRLKLFSGLL